LAQGTSFTQIGIILLQ